MKKRKHAGSSNIEQVMVLILITRCNSTTLRVPRQIIWTMALGQIPPLPVSIMDQPNG